MSRATGTLSGGEAQRIRLATQIGSGLVGVAYILDEPSIGLHQRDNDKLLKTLKHLRDLGNTVLVVEHDEDTMRAADYIVDIGPGAGEHGGRGGGSGHGRGYHEKCRDSITGAYLERPDEDPGARRAQTKPTGWLTVKGAQENNLKNIDVDFPLGVLTCVTGVSGSGKSSLVNEILYKALAKEAEPGPDDPGQAYEISRAWSSWTRSLPSTSRPSAERPGPIRPPIPACLTMIRDLFAATHGCQSPGLQEGPFQLQCEGRPLRGLQRRRYHQDRDAFPAGRVRALRGLPGKTV